MITKSRSELIDHDWTFINDHVLVDSPVIDIDALVLPNVDDTHPKNVKDIDVKDCWNRKNRPQTIQWDGTMVFLDDLDHVVFDLNNIVNSGF